MTVGELEDTLYRTAAERTIAAQEERIRQLRNGLEGYAEQWHRVYCDKITVFAACQREICIEARTLLAEQPTPDDGEKREQHLAYMRGYNAGRKGVAEAWENGMAEGKRRAETPTRAMEYERPDDARLASKAIKRRNAKA